MDWLNQAKRFLGNLFGGAQRTIGQISSNVARTVGQAEQQAARTAQQAIRQIPQVPRIQLPQVRIQAPRVQMPQAPKIDFGAVGKALRGFQQGVDITGRTFTGQALTPEQQQIVNRAGLRPMIAATPRLEDLTRTLRAGAPAIDIGLALKEKGLKAFGPNEIMQRGPVSALSQTVQRAGERIAATPEAAQLRKQPGTLGQIARYQQLQATKPSETIKQSLVGGLKIIEDLPIIKQIGQTEPGKFVKENFAKPILKDFITVAQRAGGANMGEKTYSEGLKGYSQLIKDMFTVGTAVYSGGLSATLGTKGVAFLPTAAKLAPRLFISGTSQDVIGQLSEGKKPNEIDWGRALSAGATYTGLGVAIPGVTRGVGAGVGKVLSKGQATLATKAAQALPTDKNAPITVGTLKEKGQLRAQGYTNVTYKFQPQPGQVAPTMRGAIPQVAPKAPKGQEALFAEARKYKSADEFVKAQGQPLYHGTTAKFDKFDSSKIGEATGVGDWGDGFYFTDSKSVAKSFANDAGGDIVMEISLPKNLKFADGNKLEKLPKIQNILDDDMGFTDIGEYLKSKGFDGVKYKHIGNGGTEYVVYNPDVIKTKSQLTDIYNQANKPTLPVKPIYETAPKPGKLPVSNKERKFITSAKTSQEVSDDVKSVISGEYTPKSNQILINNADKFTKNPQKAYTSVNEQLSKPWGKVNDQEVANAIVLAKKLDASGNKDAAGEIYDKLAQHLTQSGRDVQAASLLSRRTPEGLLFNARRTLKKAGVEITPNIQKELQTNIDLIKKTVVGSEQRNIAIATMQKDLIKHIPQKTLDNIVSVWKAGLLSGVKTQGGNFLSNATFGTMKLASNPITAAVDKVMSLFTGKRTFALTGKGLASGGVEGAKKGIFTLKTGIDTRNFATGAAKFDQVAEINFNNKAVQSIIGTPSNWVFRGMSAADQPFYFAALKNSLYSQAIAEAKNQGLKGKALKDFLSNSLSNPNKTMLNVARNEADKAVLGFDTILSRAVSSIHRSVETSNLNPEAKAITNAIVNFIAPFTRVPSAFLSRTIDYTPLGLTTNVYKAIKNQIKTGSFDQRALAQAIGEGVTGTGLIVLGADLANKNLLSGDYPKNDQKEQARWKAQGITPNSVKLGDTWVSLNYLGPLGLLFGAGKNFVDAQKEGGTPTDVAAQTIGGFGSGLLQQSFLQGLNGFTQAVNDNTKFGQYARSFVGSFVPSWINDIANITDKYKRQANTPVEAAMARIPGIRQNLPAQVDVFGRQLETGGIQSINPFKPSPSIQTPLTNELDRLKSTGKENNAWPTPVDNKDFFGKGTEIDKKQMQQIQTELGPLINQAWNNLIQTPTYQQANDQQKKNLLDKIRQQITTQYKIANATKFGQTYTGKEITTKTPKIKVSKVPRARKGRAGRTTAKRVSLKAPRIRRIKVAAPKGTRKISFKVPTPKTARKSIKIKTG